MRPSPQRAGVPSGAFRTSSLRFRKQVIFVSIMWFMVLITLVSVLCMLLLPIVGCVHYNQTPRTVGSFTFEQVRRGMITVSTVPLLLPIVSKADGNEPATPVQHRFTVLGAEEIMRPKAHGSSEKPVQSKLRWNCNTQLADRICNYNRRFAEHAGYFANPTETTFLTQELPHPVNFYDSVTGLLLFTAPVGRTFEEWKHESLMHGWPSFRDNEVNWERVRTFRNGETVSLTGTHLGHNLPDSKGNRYCINLVSIAGYPV